MADLTLSPIWHDQIYQVETRDPVVGGVPDRQTKTGVPNIASKELGDRTEWLKQALAQLIPPGTLMWFAMPDPAPGFLPMDGGTYLRASYANLYSVPGVPFGPGNGTTTFTLPDWRGENLRIWDAGRGVDPGRIFGSWQHASHMAHEDSGQQVHNIASAGDALNAGFEPSHLIQGITQTYADATSVGAFGAGYLKSVRTRNVAAQICIKY